MTFSTHKVAAVITARNEADNIGDLVEALLASKRFTAVYVMDDGSTDDTLRAARAAGAVVFVHAASAGIRDSLLELWRNAYDAGATAIVQLDAGRSHLPEQAASLLDAACRDNADIVIGSRFARGGLYVGGKWSRKLGSRVFGWLCRFSLPGASVLDWTSGYRVFSRKALLALKDRRYLSGGHAWQAEVLAHAFEYGLGVCEAPITYIAGRSSLRPSAIVDMLNVLSDMLFHRRVKRHD